MAHPKMAYPKNAISCHVHSEAGFKQLVEDRSGTLPTSRRGEQVGYLGRYLSDLGVKTLVVEDHYVDRNFVEEAGLYYVRCLAPPPNHCARIHAFTTEISDDDLDALLTTAASEGPTVPEELRQSYRGFIVVRPLPSAPIGRTLLRPLDGDRRFHAVIEQAVHVAGLTFSVRGLPFQQQDTAVAACASVAVWSALQRASRTDGRRGPTTPEITRAAHQHWVPDGRAFPSSGLRVEQICDAIRNFDCAPVVISAPRQAALFKLVVHAYLRSGIPVIIGTDNHAITAVGYRPAGMVIGALTSLPSLRVHNLEYDQLYVHDDRLGPYARARWLSPTLRTDPPLRIEIDFPGGAPEVSPVRVGIIALYPKLRTSVEELVEALGVFEPVVELAQTLAGRRSAQLGIELFFEKAGEYQASLYGAGLDPARLASFQRSAALSRYVGVARWTLDGKPFVDTVWDTTDRIRSSTVGHEPVLGLVSYDTAATPLLDMVAQEIGKLAV